MINKRIYTSLLIFVGFAAIATLFLSEKPERQEYEQATNEETASPKAVSFITPHHLLAKKQIENIFQKTASLNSGASIKKILLVSPNHFNVANAPVVIPDEEWEKSGVNFDYETSELLSRRTAIAEKEKIKDEKDHGIFNILPFIRRYYPDAKVLPVLVRDNIGLEREAEISEFIADNYSQGSIIVLSADFSHNIGQTASNMHDKKAISVISSLDVEKARRLDIDCAHGLAMLVDFSRRMSYLDFVPLEQTSSSEILGDDMGEENTSYITGYFIKGEKKEAQSADILFLGDLMLDRYNRIVMERKGAGWPTERIKRLFWSQDINVANLEGPVTKNASVSVLSKEGDRNNLIFTFDPAMADVFLDNNGINMVNIGNNHILNFSQEGLNETKSFLLKKGIDYFGNPKDPDNYVEKKINGLSIAFINFNAFSGVTSDETLRNINEAEKNNDFVIVYTHWGNEYETVQNRQQEILAHSFIDAGADFIIGTHPHVVQPIEIYKERAIFYSLGNFYFDQYFSEDTTNMFSVGIRTEKNGATFSLIPLVQQKNGQISIAGKKQKEALLTRIAKDSKVGDDVRDDIMKAEFQLNY